MFTKCLLGKFTYFLLVVLSTYTFTCIAVFCVASGIHIMLTLDLWE